MIKEPYTDRFYSYHSKYISNALALRPPQHESLEIFARLCDILSLKKNPNSIEDIYVEHQVELETLDEVKREKRLRAYASAVAEQFYKADLDAVRTMYPTLTSFERDFPSVCFALATGIGKPDLWERALLICITKRASTTFL